MGYPTDQDFEEANRRPTPPNYRRDDPSQLTIRHAQEHQPWTIPYALGFKAANDFAPHLYGAHTVLHAAKSVGKLAAIFEKKDHGDESTPVGEIAAMAADLVTAALRLANLYKFDLATALVERVKAKNGRGFESREEG